MGLKKRVASGFKWNAYSQVGRQALQWVTTAILARLLYPSDYGLMGMAIVLVNFVQIFKGLGTSAAVIQKKNISNSLLSSIFWFNLLFGLLATIIVFALSPAVACFYNETRLTEILRVISLCFFISSLTIVHQAILERDLAFSKLAKVELSAVVIASIIGIGAAIIGAGVWSLVFKSIAEVVVTTVMLWFFTGWRPAMAFKMAEIKSITSFSLNLTGFNILNYFSRNADYILIGRFLGATDLGYYTLAYRIMFFPLMNVTNAIARVVFPFYSRIQDDLTRFKSAYLNVIGSIALITFPMMIGVMAVSKSFVLVIFGAKWEPVSLLIMILAPVGLVQSVISPVGGIYQAKGRTDWMLRFGVFSSLLYVTSFVIGLRWGIMGIAIAYGIAVAIIFYPSLAIPFHLIDLKVRDLLTAIFKPFLCSSLMVLTLFFVKALLPIGLSKSIALAVLVSTGVIIYVVISWFINGDMIRKILGMVGVRIGPIPS